MDALFFANNLPFFFVFHFVPAVIYCGSATDSICVRFPSLWSGNLLLSLVIIPVRIVPAVLTEDAISICQADEPSGAPLGIVPPRKKGASSR